MKIKVLLFGMLADAAKQSVMEVENINDTDGLLIKLKDLNTIFCTSKFVISVNRKVVTINKAINENDEVALLPPFAGG